MLRSSLLALRTVAAARPVVQAPLRRLATPVAALRSFSSSTARPQEDPFFAGQYYGSSVAVQQPAPFFKGTAVADGAFKEVSLSDYKGKYLVLLFYPMDWTFVCPSEVLSFDQALPRFKELNTEVLGVSTDSEYSHLAWASHPRSDGGLGPDLKLPLFADKNHAMSSAYGVLLPEQGVALRGLFIIDPEGITRQITINDLPVGRSVEETIRLIQAFQFTAEHGEVCPANWSPENPATIKPTPAGSKEYFGKQVVEKVKDVL